MLSVVWYTQVFPTAMGYSVELAGTNVFEVVAGVALGPELTLDAMADVVPEAASDVLADAPHPARATTAVPARTARADRNLLI
jgi:hypothetical protein